MHTGRLELAEAYQRAALAQRRALFGPSHPEVAGSLEALSAVLYRQAETGSNPRAHEDADEMLCRALNIVRRTLGKESREYEKLAPYILSLHHHDQCRAEGGEEGGGKR